MVVVHRIVGEAFAGYSAQDIVRVRELSKELLAQAPDQESIQMLQDSIDSCNDELARRGVRF